MSEKKKLKLTESFSVPNNSILLKSDNKKLIENINEQINNELSINPSEPFSCYAVIKDVPVTRFTLNFNNRIYSKELWQKVSQSGVAERTWCHRNHSDDDGDVGNYLGVWHNFRVLEDKCVADLYVMDNELGRSLISGLQCGGRIHFSTFGYGDYIYDQFGNETQYIDPECYQLMRLGDWVSVSSQNVITSIDENTVGIQKKLESKLKENTETSNNEILKIDNTNKVNENRNGETMNEQESKMEISYWKNRVKTAIKESDDFFTASKFEESVSTLVDVKHELPESDKYKDLQEKIESKISAINSKKSEFYQNLIEKSNKLELENVKLKEIAEISINKMKEQTETEQSMVDTTPVSDVVALEASVEQVAQAVDQLTAVIDNKDETISDLQDQVVELQSQVVASETETSAVVAAAEEKVSELADTIIELTDKVAVLENALAKAGVKLTETMSTDMPNRPENPIGLNPKKPDSAMTEQEDEEEKEEPEEMMTEEEDVSAYVDKVIQAEPELKEHRYRLKQSKDVKSVDRKINNLKVIKEERQATTGNTSSLDGIDFENFGLGNKIR